MGCLDGRQKCSITRARNEARSVGGLKVGTGRRSESWTEVLWGASHRRRRGYHAGQPCPVGASGTTFAASRTARVAASSAARRAVRSLGTHVFSGVCVTEMPLPLKQKSPGGQSASCRHLLCERAARAFAWARCSGVSPTIVIGGKSAILTDVGAASGTPPASGVGDAAGVPARVGSRGLDGGGPAPEPCGVGRSGVEGHATRTTAAAMWSASVRVFVDT